VRPLQWGSGDWRAFQDTECTESTECTENQGITKRDNFESEDSSQRKSNLGGEERGRGRGGAISRSEISTMISSGGGLDGSAEVAEVGEVKVGAEANDSTGTLPFCLVSFLLNRAP